MKIPQILVGSSTDVLEAELGPPADASSTLGGLYLLHAELSSNYLCPSPLFWIPQYPKTEPPDDVPWWLNSRGSLNS